MKLMINNLHKEDICVQIYKSKNNSNANNLAFICHGISGYKEQDVIVQTAKTLNNLKYTVITFDCRNSRGKSFNNKSCATLTSMYDDLLTVIDWAQKQNFYTPRFLLAGHSLGGSVILNYAQNHPQVISHLILLSTIFDGNELFQNTAEYAPNFLRQIQNGGVIRSKDNIDCFLDDTYLKDLQQYDFYKQLKNINFPVLLITGDKDTSSLPQNNQRFYISLQSPKELYVLINCTHIYDTKQNKKDLDNKIKKFLKC